MKPAEYLDAAREALAMTSDYQLARYLQTPPQRISAYRKGKEWPDNYIVMQLAMALKLDPVSVLADLESQHEHHPVKKAFWQSFCSRACILAVVLGTLEWTCTAHYGSAYANELSPPNARSMRIIRDYVKRWLSECETRLQEFMENAWFPCTSLAISRLAVKT